MSHTYQFSKSPIAVAVSAALVTPAAALAQEEGASGDALENIIVTARKRDEDIQRIPASVQAIPEAMLNNLGVLTTEDFARFIPSMVWRKESGAGDNQIIFRGINTGASDFIAKSSASMYLDETPMTFMGDQPGIRMMDIARVEALAGPQGTLFGAAAQSGTLRIITNQPDASQFEGSLSATLRGGEESDASYDLTGVINIPIVEDVFAIRIAAQTAEDGGFIDNVFGHTPDTWFGYDSPGNGTYLGPTRAEWGTLDNAAVAEENWNSVEHIAVKVAARWDINENFAATLTYNYAENEAQANNDYNPFVGDLQTIQFLKNYTKEEWDSWSLTLEADLGFAQFVSATSFVDREYAYSHDATFYYKYWQIWACEDRGAGLGSSNPAYAWYWADPVTGGAIYYPMYCPMGPPRSGDRTQQADFIGVVEGPSWQYRFSQEFRLSHQGEKFDWLAGLYYDDADDNWDAVWMKSTTADYQDTTSFAFVSARYSDATWCADNYADPAAVGCGPGTTFPDAEYVFLSADRTVWEQKAVFGEVTWHINAKWDATFGGRWFETENTKSYLKYHAGRTLPNGRQQGGIIQPAFAPGTVGGTPVVGEISEFVPKFSLSWQINDNNMVYGLYTEGYRTGGINRANSRADWSRTFFPQAFEPDKLANYEIGARTRTADGRLQFNVTFFYMDWEDFQIELVDPSFGECVDPAISPPACGPAGQLPWLKAVGNAGDAHSSGIEAHLDWIPADGWNVGANAQWLEKEIDETLILEVDDDPPFAPTVVLPKGQGLPNAPEFKGSLWASYSWPVTFISGGEMFIRGNYSYTGESDNLLVPSDPCCSSNPSFVNPSYSIADVRIGLVSRDAGWQLEGFVNNVGDERAVYYTGTGDFDWAFGKTGEYSNSHRLYINRPREYGIRFSMKWGD